MKILVVNTITMSRAPLAIVAALLMLYQQWFWAWLCFLVSAATDVIDGPLARRWKAETQFGAAMDVAHDVSIFWVYILGVGMYGWRYHQPTNSELLQYAVGAFGMLVVALIATIGYHGKIYSWWRTKGNFWCGVIPVAIIGLWISWHAGLLPLVTTVGYGVTALWYNAEKIRERFL